jgi:hypothetical protein
MKSPFLQVKKKSTEKDVSYKSDMIGMPGSSTRKKVDADIKGKKVNSPAKMIREKGTGEVYTYIYNSTPSNITYYRFIATDGNTDAFYTYFSGSTLSGLVASKSISI